MNFKRLLLGLLAAYSTIVATDYVIHQIWLRDTYAPGIGRLWRTEDDMKSHMAGLFVGEFLVALAFTALWFRISLHGAGLACAVALGVMLGVFYSGSAVMQNAVLPLPSGLMLKWIAAGILQCVLVGIVLFLVCRPAKPCPDIRGA